jgi:hypothetical protein
MVPEAKGWGTEGHEIVAELAERLILPSTKQALQPFLAGKSLYQVSTLPDDFDHTTHGAWSFTNHFCNLAADASRWEPNSCPLPRSCVVRAIANYSRLFMNQYHQEQEEGKVVECSLTNKDEEPCPLSFLVHYVGDIHQPLHVGYGLDEGGNLKKVRFFGHKTDLHTVWDSLLIRKHLNGQHWMHLVAELEAVVAENPQQVIDFATRLNARAWADESFALTRSEVYRFDNVGDGRTKEDVLRIGEEVVAEEELAEWYFERNIKVVQARLIAAGVRLAALLDSILAPSASSDPLLGSEFLSISD